MGTQKINWPTALHDLAGYVDDMTARTEHAEERAAELEKENAERKVDPVLGQPVEYWHNRWVDENVERIQLQRERDSLLAALKNANENSEDMMRDLRGVQDAHVDAERRVRWLEGQLKVRDHNIDHQKGRIVELTKERDGQARRARKAEERVRALERGRFYRDDYVFQMLGTWEERAERFDHTTPNT